MTADFSQKVYIFSFCAVENSRLCSSMRRLAMLRTCFSKNLTFFYHLGHQYVSNNGYIYCFVDDVQTLCLAAVFCLLQNALFSSADLIAFAVMQVRQFLICPVGGT